MAEDGPAEESLFVDTDDDAAYSVPQRLFNRNSPNLLINRSSSSQCSVAVPTLHPSCHSLENIPDLSYKEMDNQTLELVNFKIVLFYNIAIKIDI